MVKKKEDMPQQPESQQPEQPQEERSELPNNIEVEKEYLELAQQSAAKDVVLPTQPGQPAAGQEVATSGVKSLSEAIDDATDLTDMQFAMAKMFPKDVKVDDVMIGRVAPDAFLSLLQLMVTNDVMTANPNLGVDVNALIIKNYIKLTIGLGGRGRIDVAELLGAAREIKKEENLLKSL